MFGIGYALKSLFAKRQEANIINQTAINGPSI